MEQSKQQQIRELTDRLNRCRYEYYNLNAPSLTDAEYDALFDELSMLEKETGFSMTNSPTQTVGCYPAVSALVKTAHPIPLLSLDKTKSSAADSSSDRTRLEFMVFTSVVLIIPNSVRRNNEPDPSLPQR